MSKRSLRYARRVAEVLVARQINLAAIRSFLKAAGRLTIQKIPDRLWGARIVVERDIFADVEDGKAVVVVGWDGESNECT